MSKLSNISINGSELNVPASLEFKSAIISTTDIDNLEPGIYTVSTSNQKFPVADVLYGSLVQFNGTYKSQVLIAGLSGDVNMFIRRYLTSGTTWTDWIRIYALPDAGIPASDLSVDVQTLLDLADTAIQPNDLAQSNVPGLVGVNPTAFAQVSNQKNIVPPTGGELMFNLNMYSADGCPIYVPSESVNAYKTANIWLTYANRIQAI